MPFWRFSPYEQIKPAVFDSFRVGDECPACTAGALLRLAMRENFPPYSWMVMGFTCNTCYAIFAFGPRGSLA